MSSTWPFRAGVGCRGVGRSLGRLFVIRALVVDPLQSVGFRFDEVAEPVAQPDELVLDVHHVSLNRGDLNDARSGRLPAGAVLGSDVAGMVATEAADDRSPRIGTRVVAMTQGAFAERCVVDVGMVAEVPAEVDLAATAALPVAGLAALRSLRAGGGAAGKRVLVTGASGGVGRFAVQLAREVGAHVIAATGSAAQSELIEAGADEVVTDLADVAGPVDVVIDSVGGSVLVAAWGLLAPGGNLQSVGWTSGEPAVFPPYSTIGSPKSLTSYLNEGPVGPDLAVLVDLLVAGKLIVPSGWRGPWTDIHKAASAMVERRMNGKAILDVIPSHPRD